MKIIGHRGAKGLAPENTLASFAKALEHNVDEIECDVRITKDTVAVLEHDEWLSNQGGEALKVADHTYAQLKSHKPELTTLEEALRMIDRAVPLYIEIKPGEPTEPVAACVTKLLNEGWQPENFLFASYSYKVLCSITAALPSIALIVIEDWSSIRAVWRAKRLGVTRLSMNQRWLYGGFIKAMARRGYQISTYTLDDPIKAQRWVKSGLFAVVTDYPDNFESAKIQ